MEWSLKGGIPHWVASMPQLLRIDEPFDILEYLYEFHGKTFSFNILNLI